MESFSTLRLLLNILTGAVTTIEGVYADANQPPPFLDEPFVHYHPSEALKRDPRVSEPTIFFARSHLTYSWVSATIFDLYSDLRSRQERLTGTSGVAAIAESAAENSFKGSTFLMADLSVWLSLNCIFAIFDITKAIGSDDNPIGSALEYFPGLVCAITHQFTATLG
ncbi:hypothetical protein K438DRAFT_1975289 [Mycena galopus ATCC 62051]|nr:hypothetical protein K438DRAFT_1975289 [Mycena galopus ATCC 62051]